MGQICATHAPPHPHLKDMRTNTVKKYYRLRYSCDTYNSNIRIYDQAGKLVGKCRIEGDTNDCEDFSAHTAFTFSKKVLDIWSCRYGFNCIAKDSLGLFRSYEIQVEGSVCKDNQRKLSEEGKILSWSPMNMDVFMNIPYPLNLKTFQGMYSPPISSHLMKLITINFYYTVKTMLPISTDSGYSRDGASPYMTWGGIKSMTKARPGLETITAALPFLQMSMFILLKSNSLMALKK